MTSVYFVRHAQPVHTWEDDRTRPLTSEGMDDSKKVLEVLKELPIHYFLSSPYKRSMDTIYASSITFQMIIQTDDRFRERQKGIDGNNHGMFQKRWNNFDFCEDGGESLSAVQKRNIEALLEVLQNYKDKNIVIGTHGTALSTILNYFDASYKCDNFLRIIDYMPYIIRLDFDGVDCVGKEEILIIEKEFPGEKRADKMS